MIAKVVQELLIKPDKKWPLGQIQVAMVKCVNQDVRLNNLPTLNTIVSAVVLRIPELVFANDNPAVSSFKTRNPAMCKENLKRRFGHATGRPLFQFNKHQFSVSHSVNPDIK